MTQDILLQILDKLGSIDNRIESLETRFDKLEARFDKLEDKVDVLETRFDKLDDKVDALEGRFDRLQGKVDVLETRFDNFESNQLTFHNLLRETRLEFETRDRIARERHEEIIRKFSHIESDIDFAINKTNRNERELARLKKQIEAS